jgi:hypothetical protein
MPDLVHERDAPVITQGRATWNGRETYKDAVVPKCIDIPRPRCVAQETLERYNKSGEYKVRGEVIVPLSRRTFFSIFTKPTEYMYKSLLLPFRRYRFSWF